jgi:hypothetical protein
MCDFSLHHLKSRPAKVGDKLRTFNFSTGTRGFAAPEDSTTAVCILPGTELAFSEEVKCAPTSFGFSSWRTKTVNCRTAIFRQINKDQPRMHHNGAPTSGTAKNASRGSSPEPRRQLSGIKHEPSAGLTAPGRAVAASFAKHWNSIRARGSESART